MKKLLGKFICHFRSVVVIMSVVAGIQLKASAQCKTLTFDFKEKNFTDMDKLEDLKKGDCYQVKVTNINSSLYKVEINNIDSTVSKALPVATFSLLGLGDLSTMVGALSPVGSVKGTSSAIQKSANRKIAFDLLMKNADFSRDIKDEITGNKATVADEAKLLLDAQQEVIKKQLERLKNLKEEMNSVINKYNAILIVASVEFQPDQTTGLGDLSGLTIKKLYDELNQIRASLLNLDKDVRLKHDNYLRDSKAYASVIEGNPALKTANDNIKTAHAEFNTVLTKMLDQLSADNNLKFIQTIVSVINNASYGYTSIPLQFSKEQAQLTLSITPRKPEYLLHSYKTILSFPLRTNKFWGISTGFFISSLHNEAYSTQQLISETQDTTYTLVSEEPVKKEFGINAMVRYGERISNSKTFWHVGFGPGAAISDKIQPRIMAGGGLAFGTNHRVVMDVGGILGFTDRLSKVHSLNIPESQSPDRVTVSRLNSGVYFSLGYVFN